MNVGDKAPEILGLNERGEEIRLSNYKRTAFYFNRRYRQEIGGAVWRMGREEYVRRQIYVYFSYYFYY